MSRVELLKAAGSSNSVKFLEATRAYSKSPSTILCIFEGEDEKYYGCRVSMSFGDNGWHGINTGGKSAVLDLRKLLSEHNTYKSKKFICFIDRDYEDWLINPDPERVYITPCYSVENLYASKSCLNSILSAEFKVTELNALSTEHQKCIAAFEARFKEVFEHLLPFNSWAKSRVIQIRSHETPVKMILKKATLEKLIDITLTGCTIKYNPSDISTLFNNIDNSMLCTKSVKEATNSFPSQSRLKKFRGKQQVEAFRQFLIALKNDFTTPGNIIFTKKGKLKIVLDSEDTDLLSEISQYAETPDCLRDFLAKHSIKQNPKSSIVS